MATPTKSELDEARQKAHKLDADEKRIGWLDSRSRPEKGDPLLSTLFLIGIFALTIVLCLILMLFLAGG
jgi:hypothetical protein